MMKKLLTLFLTLALSAVALLSLPSCMKMSTDGLLEVAPELIARSDFFNDIYYGEGIPYTAVGDGHIGDYFPADPAFLDEHGFHTIEELKAKTAEVFSQGYCKAIFSYAFSGHSGEVGGYIYARYSSSQAENLRDENETILVGSGHSQLLTGDTVYDYSSLKIIHVTSSYVTVEINSAIITPATDSTPETRTEGTLQINFVQENGEWRIDSATY